MFPGQLILYACVFYLLKQGIFMLHAAVGLILGFTIYLTTTAIDEVTVQSHGHGLQEL